ncbi:hypothetical protein Btru_050830 [Bulinus truncatus]|nr:hypothetical protein Btru_050830 [Bulinus truncatus]
MAIVVIALVLLAALVPACRAQTFRAINVAVIGPSCEAPNAAVIDDRSSLLITTSVDLEGQNIHVFSLSYVRPNSTVGYVGYWMPGLDCNGFRPSASSKLLEEASCIMSDETAYFLLQQRVLPRFRDTRLQATIILHNRTVMKSHEVDAPVIYDKIIERLDINGQAVSMAEGRILINMHGMLVRYCVSPVQSYIIEGHMNDLPLGRFENRCLTSQLKITNFYESSLLLITVQETTECRRRIVRRLFITPDDTFRNY